MAAALVAFAYLLIQVVLLLAILRFNRVNGRLANNAIEPIPQTTSVKERYFLEPSQVLEYEFKYAQKTASEAMRDRHTTINFYLLIVGIVISGVVTAAGTIDVFPFIVGGILLWALCPVGWLYFLILLRFRQAWHASAQAMNQIKDFYIDHVETPAGVDMRDAFLWQSSTLPPPHRAWNVFFFSAMVVALLNTFLYVAGAALVVLRSLLANPLPVGGLLILLALLFLAFHGWFYFAFLRPPATTSSSPAMQERPENDIS